MAAMFMQGVGRQNCRKDVDEFPSEMANMKEQLVRNIRKMQKNKRMAIASSEKMPRRNYN